MKDESTCWMPHLGGGFGRKAIRAAFPLPGVASVLLPHTPESQQAASPLCSACLFSLSCPSGLYYCCYLWQRRLNGCNEHANPGWHPPSSPGSSPILNSND